MSPRIQAIAHLAQTWLKPNSFWMRQAERMIPKHTPYSKEMVHACLTSVFQGYDHKTLHAWIQRDLPKALVVSPSESKALIVSPSTVFAAVWQAATACWLAGMRIVIRPSRREPIFSKLLMESAISETEGCLPVQMWRSEKKNRRPCDFQAVIVYGTDETISHLRLLSEKKSRFIGFGSKMSLAYISKRALHQDKKNLLNRAAWDAVLYDTQGCLSPQCFFIEEGGSISPIQFARQLADAMENLDARLPRTPIEQEAWEEEGFWQHWQFLQSQGRARIFKQHVVFHQEPIFEPPGLRRVVFVAPIRRVADIKKYCHKWVSRLSAIGVSDHSSLIKLEQLFGRDSSIRFCEVGQMHQPPPDWHNGGVNLLSKLVGYT